MHPPQLREVSQQELIDYMSKLFWSAFKKAPFQAVCAVLRVSGLQDADWDPFEESKEAFEDYNALIRLDEATLSKAGHWRIALLMYCQAVEMTAPQEFLANVLRILGGEKYHNKALWVTRKDEQEKDIFMGSTECGR